MSMKDSVTVIVNKPGMVVYLNTKLSSTIFKTESIDDGPDFWSLIGPVLSQIICMGRKQQSIMSQMKIKHEIVLQYDIAEMLCWP